jgi:hypothetical protein
VGWVDGVISIEIGNRLGRGIGHLSLLVMLIRQTAPDSVGWFSIDY